jgi:hypothetical protein
MPAWIDLKAYQVIDLTVNTSTSVTGGWARTWGGQSEDVALGITVDANGNSYVGGGFGDTVDFDAGAGTDNHTSLSGILPDASLSKYDSSGNFQWARTWGGSYIDAVTDVACDSLGNIYATGYYGMTVDFDPGTGIDSKSTVGQVDCYLSKFSPSGDYLWSVTWGGTGMEMAYSMVIGNSDNVIIVGRFDGTADFDPGAGIVNHTSAGSDDCFLMCLNSSGSYIWADTWGGVGSDYCTGVHATSTGLVFATGYFDGTIDLDPTAGVLNRTSNGSDDSFLSQFDSSGNWNWSQTWGGTGQDDARCVTASSVGIIYVGGSYEYTVDFDPGPGTASYTSNGDEDAFLTTFNTMGSFTGALAWGGASGQDYVYAVCLNESSSYLYVTGIFSGTCDLDPGTGTDNRTAVGLFDIYISRFDLNPAFQLTRTIGGTSMEMGRDIQVHAGTGNVFISGAYAGTVDFDPGSGTDNHTAVQITDYFVTRLNADCNW